MIPMEQYDKAEFQNQRVRVQKSNNFTDRHNFPGYNQNLELYRPFKRNCMIYGASCYQTLVAAAQEARENHFWKISWTANGK